MHKVKYLFLVCFLFNFLSSFSQFKEKELDLGVGFHASYDIFNTYDIVPVIDIRYNRHNIFFGPTIGYNKDELGPGPDETKPDGILLSYAFRFNKLKRKFDFWIKYSFMTENFITSYPNSNNQVMNYQENGKIHSFGFQTNYNVAKRWTAHLFLSSGYRFTDRKLSNLDTKTTVSDPDNNPVAMFSLGFKYNIIRIPRKSGKKVF
ncbi:MAG: hypothetical protein ABIJ97_08015 [Bacteroidota bacterium]